MGGGISVANEWGRLREVIVGIVPDKMIIPPVSYSIANYVAPEIRILHTHAEAERQ